MDSFNNVTYAQFKQTSGEFFRATKDPEKTSIESVYQGFKTLGLMWLNRDDWDERQLHESMIIMDMATAREAEVIVRLT